MAAKAAGLEGLLSGLRDFSTSKLEALDSIFSGHQEWLTAAVEDVKRHIAELGPAAKKQKLTKQRFQPILSENHQVRPSPTIALRICCS